MGVYFKHTKKPANCKECLAYDHEQFICSFDPKECPIIPVPQHGRLIDADEFKLYLAKMLIKYAPAFKTAEYAHFAVQLTEAIASDIDEAPTVIPAEEGS